MNNKLSGLLLIITSSLFMASCEKEELMDFSVESKETTERQNKPIDIHGAKTNRIQADAANFDQSLASENASAGIFIMIKIDHLPGKSAEPDYSVTVTSDGHVTYDGRGSVAVKGKIEQDVKGFVLEEIKGLFEHSGFSSILQDLPNIADAPRVYTTWKSSSIARPITLMDYNRAYPMALVSLRIKAESILNIPELVHGEPLVTVLNSDASTK